MSAPASTCPHCQRRGTISGDQRSRANSNGVSSLGSILLNDWVRFWCPCSAEWTVRIPEALAHGAWLDQTGLR